MGNNLIFVIKHHVRKATEEDNFIVKGHSMSNHPDAVTMMSSKLIHFYTSQTLLQNMKKSKISL